MIPYKNTVKHDPKNGTYGDCHRACFCTILGIDPKHVPHFYERGDAAPPEEAREAIERFLEGRGLVQGHVIFAAAAISLEDVLRTTGALMPGVPLILGGRSSIGCGHSVVVLNGEIFNDPTGSGIVGPLKDGNYWITFFSPRPASAGEGAAKIAALTPRSEFLPKLSILYEVGAERKRQIEKGYNAAHDDNHQHGHLALAAALMALPYEAVLEGTPIIEQSMFEALDIMLSIGLDFALAPEPDPRARKIKALALLFAEVERMDRKKP